MIFYSRYYPGILDHGILSKIDPGRPESYSCNQEVTDVLCPLFQSRLLIRHRLRATYLLLTISLFRIWLESTSRYNWEVFQSSLS